MNTLASKAQIVCRLRTQFILMDESDGVPTLYWSPELSVFQDAAGNERHLWSLEARAVAENLCRVMNVRFVNCSNPLQKSS